MNSFTFDPSMISCKNIRFQYPNGPGFSFPDIYCPKHEQLMILGESGKGKTTLLHIMAGILSPQEGEVIIADQNITTMGGSELDTYRGSHVGIIFQTAHFIASLSVMENLLIPGFLTGSEISHEDGLKMLERLNIAHKSKESTDNLSVGEKQRLSIARALITNPSIVLADEPTSALDDKNAHEVIMLLEEQASYSGSSLIVVTHDNRLKSHFQNSIEL